MRIYICVDDTDDLTKSTSTGRIADMIGKAITKKYGGRVDKGVTRHQLLIHEDIDYTSHNSSMCTQVRTGDGAPHHDPLRLAYAVMKTAARLTPRQKVLQYYDELMLRQEG